MIDYAEDLRVLICAPLRKDAELTATLLAKVGLASCICADLSVLLNELRKGAGVIIAVEEALPAKPSIALSNFIATQPNWSDLPILVLTKPGGESPWIEGAYERLGNLTLLERPVRASTLISAARSAIRARQRQYEVRKADLRKDEFLAMLGHELRNPLAPIGAAAELLGLVSTDPEKVKMASEIISRQVCHITGLVDDLLDVARVTRGLVVLDKELIDIRQIVSESVEQVRSFINTRKHQLLLDLPSDPALVLGDRKRLIQVVANILNNASKYTPEGGVITVRLQVTANEVVLDVIDNGIGMAPEMVARVFELFAQASRASDRSQGGLGLGLSLVKSLVESHQGTVIAKSNGLGKGSTFTVHMPYARSTLAPGGDLKSDTAQLLVPPAPVRVMVVDDNVDAAHTLEMLLRAHGYDVSVEYSASSAIEQANRTSPQVCLLDIGLPDMDGTDLAQHLRKMAATATSVLIAVTGYGQVHDKTKTKAAGFDHHFVKPVDTKTLLGLLAQVG